MRKIMTKCDWINSLKHLVILSQASLVKHRITLSL